MSLIFQISLILMKILSVWENVSGFFFLQALLVVYYLPILIVIHWLGIIHSCYLGTFHYYYLGNSFSLTSVYFYPAPLFILLFVLLKYNSFSDFILNIYIEIKIFQSNNVVILLIYFINSLIRILGILKQFSFRSLKTMLRSSTSNVGEKTNGIIISYIAYNLFFFCLRDL